MDSVRRVLQSDFARSGVLVFAATLLANAFNYVFHFTVSRGLGPQSYGVVSVTISLISLVSVPSVILGMVVLRYAAEFSAVQDLPKLRALAERALFLGCGLAVIVAAFFVLDRVAIARYFQIEDAGIVVLAGFILASVIVLGIVRAMLQGLQDFRSFACALLLEGAGKATISVLLVHMGWGVRGAMLGFFAATFTSMAYACGMVWLRVGRERGTLLFDYQRLVRIFGGVAASTLAVTTLSYMDVVLVKHFFDPKTAGIYSAVSLAGKVLLFILGILPTVLLPKATSHAARGESAVGLFVQAFGVSILISVSGLLVLAFVPDFVVSVMAGNAFRAAVPYLFEYGVAMACLGNTLVVAAFKMALHQFNYVIGLLLVTAGEIAAVYMLHDSLGSIIHILLVGNGLALLQSMYGVLTPQECKALFRIRKSVEV